MNVLKKKANSSITNMKINKWDSLRQCQVGFFYQQYFPHDIYCVCSWRAKYDDFQGSLATNGGFHKYLKEYLFWKIQTFVATYSGNTF